MQVSALSFGASSLGSMFGPIDENEGIRAVHEALDLGVNYIDVAPFYGLTKAETVLGNAIREKDRSQIILSTKVGRYGDHEFDFTANRINRSIDESLRRLNTEYIDILFLHDIEYVPLEIIIEEAIPAVQKLKEKGKIGFYGISGFPLKLFEVALNIVQVDAIISYGHYSLNDTSLLNLLPMLQQKNIGLVHASPLAQGLLSKQGPPEWHPSNRLIRETCMKAAHYCEQKGEDIAKLAVQFTLTNEQIPTTLVSTAKSNHIQNNIKWMHEPINKGLLAEVLEILEPIHNMTWASGRNEYN